MAVSVKASGGQNWRKAFKPYLENERPGVKIGVLEGATYNEGERSGQLVAPILAAHEFGAEIDMPERAQAMHFKQNRDGSVGNRFVKKDKSDFAQDATVGAHTITLPARAPMRSTVAKKKKEWVKAAVAYLKARPGDIEGMFKMLGELAAKDIQQAFEDGLEPPLQPATIKRKEKMGYAAHASTPVMLTGATQQSISSEYTGNLEV